MVPGTDSKAATSRQRWGGQGEKWGNISNARGINEFSFSTHLSSLPLYSSLPSPMAAWLWAGGRRAVIDRGGENNGNKGKQSKQKIKFRVFPMEKQFLIIKKKKIMEVKIFLARETNWGSG